jgi:hypothetical protein
MYYTLFQPYNFRRAKKDLEEFYWFHPRVALSSIMLLRQVQSSGVRINYRQQTNESFTHGGSQAHQHAKMSQQTKPTTPITFLTSLEEFRN